MMPKYLDFVCVAARKMLGCLTLVRMVQHTNLAEGLNVKVLGGFLLHLGKVYGLEGIVGPNEECATTRQGNELSRTMAIQAKTMGSPCLLERHNDFTRTRRHGRSVQFAFCWLHAGATFGSLQDHLRE